MVFLFLQNWRATLIPTVAIPVSLVGTFAFMMMMGYSINLITLFGLVLAIGIVVDDAIIVIENVERILKEEKLPIKEAVTKQWRYQAPLLQPPCVISGICACWIYARDHRRAL